MKQRKQLTRSEIRFKTQHWIPRRYLRQWAVDESRLVNVFSHTGVALGQRFARGLFQEDDMYTRVRTDGSRDVSIEKGLSDVETKFGAVMPKIERRELLTSDEAGWLLAFACAMHARTPTQREHDRLQWANVLKVARDVEQSARKLSPEQHERRRRQQPPRSTGDEKSLTIHQVQAIVDAPLQTLLFPRFLATLEQIGKLNMALTVFCAPPEHLFVTSDAPSIWFDERIRSPRDAMYSRGMESPTFEINFPLSPRRFLVLSHIKDAEGYCDVRPDHAREFNRRIVTRCDRYFVSTQHRVDPKWFSPFRESA